MTWLLSGSTTSRIGQDHDGQAEQHGDPQQGRRGPHGPDGQEEDDQGERRQRRPADRRLVHERVEQHADELDGEQHRRGLLPEPREPAGHRRPVYGPLVRWALATEPGNPVSSRAGRTDAGSRPTGRGVLTQAMRAKGFSVAKTSSATVNAWPPPSQRPVSVKRAMPRRSTPKSPKPVVREERKRRPSLFSVSVGPGPQSMQGRPRPTRPGDASRHRVQERG